MPYAWRRLGSSAMRFRSSKRTVRSPLGRFLEIMRPLQLGASSLRLTGPTLHLTMRMLRLIVPTHSLTTESYRLIVLVRYLVVSMRRLIRATRRLIMPMLRLITESHPIRVMPPPAHCGPLARRLAGAVNCVRCDRATDAPVMAGARGAARHEYPLMLRPIE